MYCSECGSDVFRVDMVYENGNILQISCMACGSISFEMLGDNN